MLFPIGQLLEGRPPPRCVPLTAQVKEALDLMVRHDFSQLPVVDENGHLVGLISDHSITRTYHLLGEAVPLHTLTVDHCLVRVEPLDPDEDVFAACDQLRNAADALVVVVDRKPIGLLTAYDMTNFFRHRSEDFLRIEDIEVTLRLRTRDAFPDDDAMDRALLAALGPNARNPAKPFKPFNELSMGELLLVMTDEANWPQFGGMFEPLELFKLVMNRVRHVRNMLTHFRGEADTLQDRTLKYALDWLAMRTRASAAHQPTMRRVLVDTADVPARAPDGNRWSVLGTWLGAQERSPFRAAFSDLETVLGGRLPAAAGKHASWWSNSANEAQSRAWCAAGWQVSQVDLARREVIFQPVAPVPA